MSNHTTIVVCPDCDLLNRLDKGAGTHLLCRRCGAILYRYRPNSVERSLALTITALILFLLSNCFPFLIIKSGGIVQETVLFTGIHQLWQEGLQSLAALVFVTCILMPTFQMLGLLYILAPLKWFHRPAPNAIHICRLVQGTAPWCMMEVFMVGILVALVKLGNIATVVVGTSVIAFGILIFVMAAALSTLDLSLLWKHLDLRQ